MERKEVMSILKKYCPENIVKHCILVNKAAMKIAKKIKSNNYNIDLNLIEASSLLHDIGRIKTHSIKHSYEGGKILKKLGFSNQVIRIVETHIGAGVPKKEAVLLGLPKKDFINVNIDYKVHGVGGSNSWGKRTLPYYTIDGNQEWSYGFTMRVIE